MPTVKIGQTVVGDGEAVYVIGEIGINHNGDLAVAKKLIDEAGEAGCGAVKFQKRTVNVVYTAEELARPRESPFGTTNGDLKRALEFGADEYKAIDTHCASTGIHWFASCWDEASVDFLEQFNPPAYKIASASLTDDNLLRHHRRMGRPIILSTGMSTQAQVDHAVEVLGTKDLIILHTTSAYPAPVGELNLTMIPKLRERYSVPVGYSGHETGLVTTAAAVALGACIVERHITLDRAMWGTDQSASVEPQGLRRLVREIRAVESALGDGVKRVSDTEVSIMKKLRRVG
jgi:N-acetylneuraminate synthase